MIKAKWTTDKNWELQDASVRDDMIDRPKPLEGIKTTPTTAPKASPKKAPVEESAELKYLGEPQKVSAAVLRVKNSYITLEEVMEASEPLLERIPSNLSESDFRAAAAGIIGQELGRRINDELIVNEAKLRMEAHHMEAIEEEVKSYRQNLIGQAGGSRKALDMDLASRGTSLERVLDTHRRALIIQRYLQMKFVPAISVNRRMLLNYYQEHMEDYRKDKKVQMQIIAARFDAFTPGELIGAPSKAEQKAASEKARKTIEKALKRVEAGEDYASVAKELSKGIKAESGGLWPMMPKGSFLEAKVEDVAFGLKEGQVSKVIETESGFYIVKAYKVDPGSVVSFEEAQESIERTLRNEQYLKLTEEFRNRLDKASVSHFDKDFVLMGVEQAQERYFGREQADH